MALLFHTCWHGSASFSFFADKILDPNWKIWKNLCRQNYPKVSNIRDPQRIYFYDITRTWLYFKKFMYIFLHDLVKFTNKA